MQQHPQRGSALVELVLVLPLLAIFLAAMIQFCLLLTTREQFLAASRAAARVAAQGRSDEEVEATARRTLGSGRMDAAHVEIRQLLGDPLQPEEGGDRVEVTVHAPAAQVVPNFLAWAGFGFGDRELTAIVVMDRE